jgi:lysophospholipase L1-like esterase
MDLRKSLTVVLLLAAATAHSRTAERWVGTWAAAQVAVEGKDAPAPESFADATLRQIVHVSAGGSRIRLCISNAFGTEPLHVLALHVAHATSPSSSRIDVSTDRAVTFNEREDVLIPAGAEYVSDPLTYGVASLSDLAVTMQIEATPRTQTGHPGSRATSYLARQVSVSAAEVTGQSFDHWYFLSGIDVSGSAAAKEALQIPAIVTLGDSITDGHGATTNGNDRWPDILSARLQKAAPGKAPAVLNVGIGGNRVLVDGLGPSILARFDRDVLARDGVRYLIVLEGINDIGQLARTNAATKAQHEELVERIIGVYRQLILRAHAHGIQVMGGTIVPFGGSEYYHPGPDDEADRQRLNAWIRSSGDFDAVVDFDRVTADPDHPERLRPQLDCGDHLHPSPAGYRAMADAIPLEWFRH